MGERTGTRGAARNPWVVLVGATVVLAVLLAAAVLSASRSADRPVRAEAPQNLSLARPDRTAPAAAVSAVHRALHRLGRACEGTPQGSREQRARRPVRDLLRFAREHPSVSFRIHDETGTTVSLLFVARAAVQSCAPSLTARVERQIPAEYLPRR